MTPVRELAVRALIERIKGIDFPGLTPERVERERQTDVKRAEFPLIVVREGEEAPERLYTGSDTRSLVIDVEAYVASALRGNDGREDVAGTAADIRARIDAIIMEDVTLGGIACDIRPIDTPREPMLDHQDNPNGRAVIRTFQLWYSTPEGDPYTVG